MKRNEVKGTEGEACGRQISPPNYALELELTTKLDQAALENRLCGRADRNRQQPS